MSEILLVIALATMAVGALISNKSAYRNGFLNGGDKARTPSSEGSSKTLQVEVAELVEVRETATEP